MSLDLHTLEMDADGYAAANVIIHALRSAPDSAEELIFPQFEHEHGKGSSRVAIASMAIHTVMKCFDEEFDAIGSESHPSATMRQLMSHGSALSALEREGWELQRAADVLRSGLHLAETVYADSAGAPLPSEDEWNSVMLTFHSYSKKLLAHWHTLRPELDKLKRGGNLPEPQDWALA